jgi:hypothetical protein
MWRMFRNLLLRIIVGTRDAEIIGYHSLSVFSDCGKHVSQRRIGLIE